MGFHAPSMISVAACAVVLAQDVREYFPDAESVNNALWALISIAPKLHEKVSKARPRH